jgi:hypothetical protein
MTTASSFEAFDREKVFYDRDNWQANFEQALQDNPDLASQLACCSTRLSEKWPRPRNAASGLSIL